jgi:hypothetical protein
VLGHGREALIDLRNATQLAQQSYEESLPGWDHSRLAFNLALYYLVREDSDTAENLYSRTLSDAPLPYPVRFAINDLDILLAVYPDHAQARAMRDLLQKSLANSWDQTEALPS